VKVKGEDSRAQPDGDGGAPTGALIGTLVGLLLEQGVDGDSERDGVHGCAGGRVPQAHRSVVAAGDQQRAAVIAVYGDDGADLVGVPVDQVAGWAARERVP
jgi:hypothetical protein